MYIPPFNITEKILHQIAEISEQVGSLNSRIENDLPSPMLRKKNQIRTIHSSLAIENNTLSLKQVTDIIDGKHVLGAPDEIQEVKNAIEAYRLMPQLDAFKEKDLLKAHGLMMSQLVRNAGHYRQEGVGVFDGNGIHHLLNLLDGRHHVFAVDDVAHFILSQCISFYGQRRVDGLDTVGLAKPQTVFLFQSDGIALYLA